MDILAEMSQLQELTRVDLTSRLAPGGAKKSSLKNRLNPVTQVF